MSNTNIKQHLLEFSQGWESYIRDCLRVVDNTNRYYVKKDHRVYDLLINIIPNELSGLIDKRIYKVKGSVGQSSITGIPWIAVMDREITESTQDGFYISYLFSRNAKKIYISVALGATQFEDQYGANSKTTEKIVKAKDQFAQNYLKYSPASTFDEMDLMGISEDFTIREFSQSMIRIADYYKGGSFFTKSYDLVDGDFTESEFMDDIIRYVDSYRKIVLDPSSSALLEVLDETVFEESDKKKDVNLDYDVKDFNPNIIDAKPKKKIKQKLKDHRTYSKPSKKVGDAGEKHVYEYERNKLLKIDRSDLADKIVKQFEDLSSYPGYDIQSFDEHGNKIYIEVKSTKTKKKSFFEISDNEVSSARKYGEYYHIYHVTDALIDPKIKRIIKNPLSYVEENKILLEPWIYKLKFSDNEK